MKNLLGCLGEWTRPVAVAGLMVFGWPASAAVLFEDSFESGVLSPAWVSKLCCQWVEDGWMHTRGGDSRGRNSMAIVHDSDSSWRNYKVSMRAQFVDTGFVDDFGVQLRTDDFLLSSGPRSGQAYQLTVYGPRGWDFGGNLVVFSRLDFRPGSPIDEIQFGSVHMAVPTTPMLIEASLIGGHIQVWIDHAKIFDFVDPDPLKAGGVGVLGIWESESRFDNVRVSSIPEPATAWTAGLGLVALMATAHRRRGRDGATSSPSTTAH